MIRYIMFGLSTFAVSVCIMGAVAVDSASWRLWFCALIGLNTTHMLYWGKQATA